MASNREWLRGREKIDGRWVFPGVLRRSGRRAGAPGGRRAAATWEIMGPGGPRCACCNAAPGPDRRASRRARRARENAAWRRDWGLA